jgi:cytochrome P450/NADPH-cytochrome P450 reductase
LHAIVPQPPLTPIIGNLRAIDPEAGIQSLMRLAQEYGAFFKLKILNREFYIASSQTLVDELSDETRFAKRLHNSLKSVRAFAGDGLFTALNEEPNWAKAHRLLMPAFGPIAIRGMFDKMLDIADQMLTRWERFGPDAPIDVTDNMTRLTLDTIALCAFSTRFNSFYQDDMHPFVDAMVRALTETGERGRRPQVVNALMRSRTRQYEADQALMREVAQQLIADRRADPDGDAKGDLLGIMLRGVDPVTREKLSDENIGYQLVTFLIAGHETTSGLLSFATYLLLKNPDVLAKARAVVDEVLGTEMPRVEHLAQLRYIEQVLMEALRVWPTAPGYAVHPFEETTIGGQYRVKPDDTIIVLVPSLHRDPAVWGDDPEAFRPERFAPELAEQLPANAWKPFGNGARACIGRPFAMQEAQLVLAMMLQRFDFTLDDPNYQLKIHETLTIKPDGLRIRARARSDRGPILRSAVAPTPQKPLTSTRLVHHAGPLKPLLVLYGSNTGSSEAFAQRIAEDAAGNGFAATVAPLDDLAGRLPAEGAVVVVTASYEGQPPDNARQFVAYADALAPGDLDGLRFAVFGCGNRQWARTYQAIPKRLDAALAKAGAARIVARGEADSGGDFFGAFDEWYAALWPDLARAFGLKMVESGEADPLTVEVQRGTRERALRLGDHDLGTVTANVELVDMARPGARSKRHVEIALPEGMTYRTGDYLAVLARNGDAIVDRAIRRFGLARDTEIVLRRSGGGASGLPLDRPIATGELLASYVELNQPATRAQVALLATAAGCPPERVALEALAGDRYEQEVLGRRASLLDLLDTHASVDLAFARFLAMLPPMRARQYSISSSPLWKGDHASLTIAVVDAPALSGGGRYQGVASSYLADAQPGDRVSVSVRPSNARFHPPADPRVPIVLICAGSGVAPFRGFIQERAAQHRAGQAVGPALLFFGIDAPDIDFLYGDEWREWERMGVVDVFLASSEAPEHGVRFVQDRVWADRMTVADYFRRDAIFYLCGDGRRMAPAVREALVAIYREASGANDATAQRWADEMEHERGRFVSDVFA